MKDEYIIINKTAIQKRIAELGKEYILLSNKSDRSLSDIEEEREIVGEQKALARILSQSTPLIPEIEKAFDEGKGVGIISYQPQGHTIDKELYNERKKHYITNLKLDI